MSSEDGVIIPKHVADKVRTELTNEYISVFGDIQSEMVTSLTKKEMIQRYALNIKFWKKRTPLLTPHMSVEELAKHAICDNACRNLFARCSEYEILEEVQLNYNTSL